MSDANLRELERAFLESGLQEDEVAYLAEAARCQDIDSDRYKRARELTADTSIELGKKASVVDIVRRYEQGEVFDPLTDDELVMSMPIINHFLERGYSIYSTETSTGNNTRLSYPLLVISGDYNLTIVEDGGSLDDGNIHEVLSDLEECLGAENVSYLGPSMVRHNKEEMVRQGILYQSMRTIISYRGQRFRIEFLDDKSMEFEDKQRGREQFGAAQQTRDELDRQEDSQETSVEDLYF